MTSGKPMRVQTEAIHNKVFTKWNKGYITS